MYRDTQYDEALLLRSAESGQPLFVLQEVVDNAEQAEEAEVAEVADDGDSQAANLGENLDPDISGYMLETLDSVALSTAASVTIPAETYVIVDDGSATDVSAMIVDGSYEIIHPNDYQLDFT